MSERESSRGRVMRFRGWSYTDNDWLSPSTIEICDNTGILKAFYGGDYVIEQWIGLTDSKGVDIYEGDIVQYPYEFPPLPIGGATYGNITRGIHKGIVRWHPEMGYAAARWCVAQPECELGPDLIGTKSTVIGNIHEHPHLLQS